MSANGSDKSIARVRAALGSGGEDGSSLKIQFFIARTKYASEIACRPSTKYPLSCRLKFTSFFLT